MKTLGELGKYQQRRRLAIALLIGLLVVALFFVRSRSIGHLHEYIESFGISLIVAAIYIGGRKSAEIVQTGPYSMTRNPLYVFSSIGAIGIGAQTGSIIIALAFGVLCYLAFSTVIRTEEKFLKANFGKPYEDYCARVPRFFPSFSLFRDDDELRVKPDRLYRTFTDGLVFFVAYPFFEFIEYLQDIGTLPVLLRLY
jgi:protein-S-isoprenylcysteine O-methyltransferase Ste14